MVFGVSDGLVSNVSLIIGFAGSGVDAAVVRLAGLAGAIAGAASMAAGEWISISAQNELIERELAVERRELLNNTAAETAELAEMYEQQGVSPTNAAAAAADVMRRPEEALNVHARQELGIDPERLNSPVAAAFSSFCCFLVGALLPVIPWFISEGFAAGLASVLLGVIAAAIVGWLIGHFGERREWYTAARQVLLLLAACAATFVVGSLLGVTVT